jgi:hypothetical protein
MKTLLAISLSVLGVLQAPCEEHAIKNNSKTFIQITANSLNTASLAQDANFYIQVTLEGAHLRGSGLDWDHKIISTDWESSNFNTSNLAKVSVVKIPLKKIKSFITSNKSDTDWKLCVEWSVKTGYFSSESLQDGCISLAALEDSKAIVPLTIYDNYSYTHPRWHKKTDASLGLEIKSVD